MFAITANPIAAPAPEIPADASAFPIVMEDSELTLDVPVISIMLFCVLLIAAVKSLLTTFEITFPPTWPPTPETPAAAIKSNTLNVFFAATSKDSAVIFEFSILASVFAEFWFVIASP